MTFFTTSLLADGVYIGDKTAYQSSPVLASGRTIPRVLLVISKDIKMFGQAYNELTDMDGDGRIDTGFNPSVIYYGYFDSKSCYEYSTTTLNTYTKEDRTQYFIRVKDTIADDSQETLDTQKSRNGIANYVKAARAVHYETGEQIGICQAGYTGNSSSSPISGRYFSGNWLNYVTMSRMDVLRKILYGGYRVEDYWFGGGIDDNRSVPKLMSAAASVYLPSYVDNRTILESSFLPRDSTVWGTDVLADNRWNAETPLTNYYDISKYTPFTKPAANKAHYFARTRSGIAESPANPPFPVLQFILNGDTSYMGSTINPTKNDSNAKGRYYNWVLNEGPNPSSSYLTDSGRNAIKSYNVKVRVCHPSNYGEGEGCRLYPYYGFKPVGLLQTNGESGDMYFGLLTGSYNETTFRKGGVLRSHINDLSSAVDLQTGQIKAGGLIYAIDTLQIAGSPKHSATNPASSYYSSGVSWGNPSGELLYEATRYYARLAQGEGESAIQPTTAYVPTTETAYNYKVASYHKNWTTIPDLPSGDCAKPIILFIAEEDSDFDGDDAVNSSDNALTRPVLTSIKSNVASSLPNAFNLSTYLDKITANEQFPSSSKYFISKDSTDDCNAKTLGSLKDVKGMCPNNPAFEGTYTAAAVAYYAHTHNFSQTDELQLPIDVYAVTMSTNFPKLDIPVYNSNGTVAKKISILPASMSDRSNVTTKDRILGFLNYYVQEWHVDPRGTPYHIKIMVNFENAAIGYDSKNSDSSAISSDWDSDQLIEYEIDLLTSSSTATIKRKTTVYPTNTSQTAGVLKKYYPDKKFYAFITPNNDTFTIEPSEVEGLAISTWKVQSSASRNQTMGYVISGSTRDATYMEITHAYGIAKNFTSAKCNWPKGAGGQASADGSCGVKTSIGNAFGSGDALTAKVIRNFEFNSEADAVGTYLPTPMFLAAKYGSFEDDNDNGVPDTGEWENAKGLPKNYFQATNIAQLPAQLQAAFQDIARSITTGTATSATVDTLLGGGVSLQTLYYPEYSNPNNPSQKLRWVGSVFGLFVDRYGNLREDNDGDGILDVENTEDGSKGDYILTFSSKKTDPANPPKCFASGHFLSRCYSPYGTDEPILFSGDQGHPKNVHQIQPLFDTGKWLAYLDSEKLISLGSRDYNAAATIARSQRLIYYGKPTGSSVAMAKFNTEPGTRADLLPLMTFENFDETIPSTSSKAQATHAVIEWIIGKDYPNFHRSRQVGDPWSDNIKTITWRLGDIINSKPIIVGTPASNFDLLYKDMEYQTYKLSMAGRRQMAYFGANDGMLHAINVGFYGSLSTGNVRFSTQPINGTPATDHDLGAEIWAYIPTSLLPHLQWLPDFEYNHSYFVDLKPLVADIKIDGSWRTVLVGGLRLGGRPIPAPDAAAAGSDFFYSEIFCIDVTDPESPPQLLWRYSSLEAGLTVGLPNFVSSEGKWYVVIPSGPRTDEVDSNYAVNAAHSQPFVLFGSNSPYYGYSSQKARLVVLDAKTGVPVVDISDPNHADYLQATEERSFFNNPFLPIAQNRAPNWTNHVLYYGLTIARDGSTGLDSGAVYRLQMVDSSGNALDVRDWKLKKFYNTDRPVTGAVNSTYDNLGNLWVVFGTGRLWGQEDVLPCVAVLNANICKANHDQYIFGIKEGIDSQGMLTFADMSSAHLIDVSGAKVFRTGVVSGLASQTGITTAAGGTSQYYTLAAEIKSAAVGGYKRKLSSGKVFYSGNDENGNPLDHRFEMIITQPKLISMGNGSSYMAFSSFEPLESGCGDNGYGFLYLVDTFTGLPSPNIYEAFYTSEGSKPTGLEEDEVAGVLTTGTGVPTEAYIMATSTGIKASTSAPDMSIHSIELNGEDYAGEGITSWKEVMNYGFEVPPAKMVEGLDGI
ncbi:MAG: hypothetical protein LBE27_01855 [Deltaproteobacteria bacterium]|nr:hypothetical protein [Deltaproteobacteria bacterium]